MNSISKFYALTLSLAATVVATTPATAANLGLFDVSGTGLSSNNVEQQIGGTFNADFSNFDIAVTTFYSPTNPSSSGTSTTSTQNYRIHLISF